MLRRLISQEGGVCLRVTFWLWVVHILVMSCAASCPPDTWGVTCEGLCHCLLRESECRNSDGHCLTGGCSRGYMGAPSCQTLCPDGSFGLACAFSCHCPPQDVCDPINGMCASKQCLQGYSGAGCQIRLPVFSVPPNVTQVSPHEMTVSWRPWSPVFDPGDGPVARYHLQYRGEHFDWTTYDVIDVGASRDPAVYAGTVRELVTGVRYAFRVCLARSDEGKVGYPYPGPSTGNVTACSAPSEPVSRLVATELPQGQGLLTISLSWKAPHPSTSGCSSIKSHRVTLSCENEACHALVTSVPMPHVTANFTDIQSDITKSIEVVPVNDVGQLGPGDTCVIVALTVRASTTLPALPSTLTGISEEGTPTTSGLVYLTVTETSLDLSWPDIGASKYEVVLTITASYSVPALAGQVQQKISLAGTFLTVRHLHAATLYVITVKPNGLEHKLYTLSVWTHPVQPPADGRTFTTRTTNPTPSTSQMKFSQSSIGLVVGLFLLVLLLLILLCCLKKKGWGLKCFSCITNCVAYRQDLVRRKSLMDDSWLRNPHPTMGDVNLTSTVPDTRMKTREGGLDNCYLRNESRSRAISVQDFVKNFHSVDSNTLAEEFYALPHGLTSTTHIASLVQNLHLNRSSKVVPYDTNRLRLVTQNKGENDYINATLYNSGKGKSYIITQTPLPATIHHFWRVIWDYRIAHIVMLCDLDTESSEDTMTTNYWPHEGESQRHGQLEVKLVKEDRFAYYTMRSFQLSLESQNEFRDLCHFQYRHWESGPDVPGVKAGVIPFLEFIQRCQRNVGPLDTCVVHCRTGSGRSGMFLAIKILLEQARKYEKIDIQGCVTLLRLERVGLVKTLSQYHFIHSALYSALSYKESVLSRRTFMAYYDNLNYMVWGEKTYMQKEFEIMMTMTPNKQDGQSQIKSPAKTALCLPDLSVPKKPPFLLTRIDSYREKGYYVVIEQPTTQKAENLCQIVCGSEGSCFVCLSDLGDSTQLFIDDCSQERRYGNWIVYQGFTIKHSELLLERKLSLRQASNESKQREVTLYHLYWSDDKPVPNVCAILDLWRRVGHTTRSNPGRLAIISASDIRRTGIFISSAVLLDQMETEGEVNIYRVVQHLRSQIPWAVSSVDQYRFCYRIVKEYLQQTDPAQAVKLGAVIQSHPATTRYRGIPNKTSTPKQPAILQPRMIDSISQTNESVLSPKSDAVREQTTELISSVGISSESKRLMAGSENCNSVMSANSEEHPQTQTANPGARWWHVKEQFIQKATSSRQNPQQDPEMKSSTVLQGSRSEDSASVEEKNWRDHLRAAAGTRRQCSASSETMPGGTFSPIREHGGVPSQTRTQLRMLPFLQGFPTEVPGAQTPVKANTLSPPVRREVALPKPRRLNPDASSAV